ncbi:MAG: hypothetical protein IPP36_07660 [Nitrosomonadales bacterium]|nr:hypothetical protein [Nitrosomonadales bacterium]
MPKAPILASPGRSIGNCQNGSRRSDGSEKSGLVWLNRNVALEHKQDWQGMLKLSQQWVACFEQAQTLGLALVSFTKPQTI